jgi:dethiobiotin synthetase
VITFVTGTGTEVGKTYVTAALARELKDRGLEVHARKPVQSFATTDAHTDADLLAAATGEKPFEVCLEHRWLRTPMAPPIAADALALASFTTADLVAELRVPASGITLIEGAGGLLSPLASDGDSATLINACLPDTTVLVADAGLGTINLVRLCARVVATPPIVYLNRFDPQNDLHCRNADWLRTRERLDITTNIDALADALGVQQRGE